VGGLRLPTRIPLRLRVFFRGAFALLAFATLALALSVLLEEKQQALATYRAGFAKTLGEIGARLRHPTGQLALLNPQASGAPGAGLRPLVLPFSAIDFDDKGKVQQAVEMSGCGVHYALPSGHDASLCVAVGNNPLIGGFIYAVGSLPSADLVARRVGALDLTAASRVRVTLTMRGQTLRWLAPYEAMSETQTRGRLTGFKEEDDGHTGELPVRDFRAWLWRDLRCLDGSPPSDPAAAGCVRQTFFSLRLPADVFREDLQAPRDHIVWPPADLDRIQVRVQVLPPGAGGAPLFDSAQAGATPPFALKDLQPLLAPGETLRIVRLARPGAGEGTEVSALHGQQDQQPSSPLVDALIRRLPVDGYDAPLQAREVVATPLGRYELLLTGDVRSVNRQLGVVASRVAWFVGATLLAVGLTWAAIELRIIRRITVLTRRAALVSQSVKGGVKGSGPGGAGEIALDVADLRGPDELGLLAGTLADLIQRVRDDARREQIRARQEQDQWHAVGHEIMSPLQSLMVLHAGADDPSHRYIQRMQQAIKVLYGHASPSEAFAATTLPVQALDLVAFARHVADNAAHAGIARVRLIHGAELKGPLWVRADEYALEDVVTHVLKNAEQWRTPGTEVTLALAGETDQVLLGVHNLGPAIPQELLETVFDYGVSQSAGAPGATEGAANAHRGQGLFVARTYMAKMGGTIRAVNEDGGVTLVLGMQRAA
jgi:signal transduction histidine kinase